MASLLCDDTHRQVRPYRYTVGAEPPNTNVIENELTASFTCFLDFSTLFKLENIRRVLSNDKSENVC